MSRPTISGARREYDLTNLAAARIILGPPEHPCTGLVEWARAVMAVMAGMAGMAGDQLGGVEARNSEIQRDCGKISIGKPGR